MLRNLREVIGVENLYLNTAKLYDADNRAVFSADIRSLRYNTLVHGAEGHCEIKA